MEVESAVTIDGLREKVRELANIYLPDGFNPFVDVRKRVKARRELRKLLLDSFERFNRVSAEQLIALLFFGDERMTRKVTTIYGQG